MSLTDGMAALTLHMPDRVPRTEYSVESHWDLIKAVTGIHIDEHSSSQDKAKAGYALRKAWNFDILWSVLILSQIYEGKSTRMGHAVYNKGGTDYDTYQFTLYNDPEEAFRFDPWELYGKRNKETLIKDFNDHYDRNCRSFEDAVNMTGIYVTMMSGLIEIFGWNMLLTMAGMDPAGFGETANRYASWIMQYFDALAECKAPVVMVHDDIVWTSGAFIHPDWYKKYIFPNYKKLLQPVIDSGKIILFTSDGNYTEFIDDIAACGVNGFVLEPLTDMKYIAEKYGKTHSFIGNADTRVLLSGTKEDIYNEVKRCMDIGKKCPGFIMAVGNHIPANTPVDNALYYNEAYEKLSKR